MIGDTLSGVAIGMGIGWLNATAVGMPGWANILIMAVFAVAGATVGDSR